MLDQLPVLALAAFILLQIMAAGYDFWTLTIPNPIVYGLAACFFLIGALQPAEIAWASHLTAGLLTLAIGTLLFRFSILGGGDVKLYAVCALWVGLGALPIYLVFVAVLGLALALGLLAMRPVLSAVMIRLPVASPFLPQALTPGAGVPYGVAIAGGAILVLLH